MKRLVIRRHSLKDGSANTIGPKGLALARREGSKLFSNGDPKFHVLFHGPLVRTAQTALAFASMAGAGFRVHPVVTGLGDDTLFGVMINDAWKAAVAGGKSNFQALLETHGADACALWADAAVTAAANMFCALNDGETGIGFFHSPTIELVAWAILHNPTFEEMPVDYRKLLDLEGIIFEEDEGGTMTLAGIVRVEPLSADEVAAIR